MILPSHLCPRETEDDQVSNYGGGGGGAAEALSRPGGGGGGGSRGAGSFEARRRGAPGHEAMGSGSVTALEEFKFYLFR